MAKSRWSLLLLALFHLLLVLSADGKKAKNTINGPIKTIVVVVMENRSFDNILGWLKRLNPEIDGLTGQESNSVDPSDPNSEKVYVNDKAEFVDPDPGHSYQAILQQVFMSNDTQQDPAPMNGFVVNADDMGYGDEFKHRVMGGFRPEVIPVYTALATEFAVFDKWFAGAPTSTQPNRMYVHSATSHGAYSNVRADLIKGFPQKTIMESVADAGLSWAVYYQNIPATLFFANLRKLKNIFKFHEYSVSFKLHAMLGMLPNYAVVEQRYFDLNLLPANDDHPSHDVAEGQKFIKEVYETLRSSPQWKEMLLLITYDEHGGFFDHVPTPINVPSPDGIVGKEPWYFKFDRLGVRVPTIAISPWINKGTVVHRATGPRADSQYEHSSIAATVKKLYGLDEFLTKRDEWAGTFEHIFNERTTPREDCPAELPSPPWSLRHVPVDETRPLTEFQEELIQLASQLNGDHVLKDYPHIGKKLNVRQGHEYVTEAVARFFKEGRKALERGVNESTILELQCLQNLIEETPLTGRRIGNFHDLLRSS
jgi:phospholipase C